MEERLCQLIERNDAWHRALFDVAANKQGTISVPGEVTIVRPGQPIDTPPPVETNVNAIAAFFAG